jgi:fermentation-respiration switch protein FrsA (DUF1100 family)
MVCVCVSAVVHYIAGALYQNSSSSRLPLPAGLILDAPFTDLKTAAAYHPSTLPFRIVPGLAPFLMSYLHEKWDSKVTVQRISPDVPLLMLHGRKDKMMGFAVGEALYAAAKAALGPDAVKFVAFDEGGHKDLFTFPLWLSSMATFLQLP